MKKLNDKFDCVETSDADICNIYEQLCANSKTLEDNGLKK